MDQLRNTRLEREKKDFYGVSVSLSSDRRTFFVSTLHHNGHAHASRQVHIFSCESTARMENELGIKILVVTLKDHFGYLSSSSDGRTVVENAAHNDDNGLEIYHMQIFIFSSDANSSN